eukprot:147009-Lingulodinium_polyedra.AAC.1
MDSSLAQASITHNGTQTGLFYNGVRPSLGQSNAQCNPVCTIYNGIHSSIGLSNAHWRLALRPTVHQTRRGPTVD